MREKEIKEKIGIIGIGRLGSALAKRLAPHCSLLLSDSFLGKARQMAKILNADFGNTRYLSEKADMILLAVPPEEICPLVEKEEAFLKEGTVLVNLATSLDTHEIKACLKRQDIRVIGLKPITQAYALAHGHPSIFVTSCEEEGLREKLTPLLREIGEIVVGNDMLVKEINAEATRWGLKLFLSLQDKLKSMNVPQNFIDVAIKTVAVGTILDYPTDGPNSYIEERLKELKWE